MDRNPSVSPSPSRRSFSDKLSALGARLTRTLSTDGTLTPEDDRRSIASTLTGAKADRSQSRGRDVYSSGRGGAGNIRQSASASRDARPEDGPDDFSVSRGREPAPTQNKSFSIGRGGAGNIRSPSRDVNPLSELTEEERVIKAHAIATHDSLHSSGRGGVGNISAQRSRSRGPAARSGTNSPIVSPVRSTGRGGAGNIISGDGHAINEKDEEERRNHFHPEEIHSTGRGGVANLTSTTGPPIEHHHHALSEFESTGRGGAGNIIRGRSVSRSRDA